MSNKTTVEKIKVLPTEEIKIPDISEIEQELRSLTKDELLYRLNYEEQNPDVIKLIKKILKTKA